MPRVGEPFTILMAEDDPDDRMLTRDALEESPTEGELRFVEDGDELLQYLRRQGPYAPEGAAPWPSLILLDLNMPRKDGRETLRELKADPELRRIPVVVLTTSRAPEDVEQTYDLGANSFITKPTVYESLIRLMDDLGRYWVETVELPPTYA